MDIEWACFDQQISFNRLLTLEIFCRGVCHNRIYLGQDIFAGILYDGRVQNFTRRRCTT